MTEDYSKYQGLEHGITISAETHPDSIMKVDYAPIPGEPGRQLVNGVAIAPSRRDPANPLIAYTDGATEVGPDVSPEFRRILTMLHVQSLEANLKAALADESK